MLIKILSQKLIVSNVILTFLDHLKPKIFFVDQPWWPSYSATPFQNLWIRPRKLCHIVDFKNMTDSGSDPENYVTLMILRI